MRIKHKMNKKLIYIAHIFPAQHCKKIIIFSSETNESSLNLIFWLKLFFFFMLYYTINKALNV